jgi:anthranilate phosphoribosyltransferase
MDGMDEISISGKSLVWDVSEYGVSPPYEVFPRDFGFKTASAVEIRGGTPQENAEMLRGILSGQRGPKRDIVIMNAAAALVAGNRASDLKEGAHIAKEAIDSGEALAKLDQIVRLSQSLGKEDAE